MELPFPTILQRQESNEGENVYPCSKVYVCLRMFMFLSGLDLLQFSEAMTAQRVLLKKKRSSLKKPHHCWIILLQQVAGVFKLPFTFASARQLRRQVLIPNTQALKMY